MTYAGVSVLPIRRLLQETILSPTLLLTTFSRSMLPDNPRLVATDTSGFLSRGVGCVDTAPKTHQDQGSVTSQAHARRPPLALVVPQKTISSLLRPSVYHSQMPGLP